MICPPSFSQPDTQVASNYMGIQTDINDKMRAILIDWLVEVHLKFKLMPETLFLTHNLIDLFLSKKVVTRKNLQVREGQVTKRSILAKILDARVALVSPVRTQLIPYPCFNLDSWLV